MLPALGQARGQDFLAFGIVLFLRIDPEGVFFLADPPGVPQLRRPRGAVTVILYVIWCKERIVELLQPPVEINFCIAFLIP